MSDGNPRLPRLRWYLIGWFAACAVLMVVAYTELLERYLERGIDLRTQDQLEQTAREYAQADQPVLPTGPSLQAFLRVQDVPESLRVHFAFDALQHEQMQRFVNIDFDLDDDFLPQDTANLCPEGRCQLVFMYPYQLDQQRWLYLFQGLVGSEEIFNELELTEQIAAGIGSVFLLLFVLLALVGVRSIDGPLRRLELWSSALGEQVVEQPPEKLRFFEFNALAQRLQAAFVRLQEGAEKEKRFLRHASHELRTPIAILSANVELLDRLSARAERSTAEQAALDRQYRALEDVQLLIDTLLWINRQSETLPQVERIDLRGEVDAITENYRHLLERRAVTVSTQGENHVVEGPRAALHMVLANLIKNAFQYTLQGDVEIIIDAERVQISNSSFTKDDADTDHVPAGDTDYGFGLGLALVAQVCERFGWQCTFREHDDGRVTRVEFS
ncbi:MAG: HAMP domain-containing sensor histidine kinase [Pseudomonadota bacterium]